MASGVNKQGLPGFVFEWMSKLNLKYLFIGWFVLMLLILVITFPEDRPIRLDTASFTMPENEEIYFKNLRSYYYNMELREDANFKLYRIKTHASDTNLPGFSFVIVQNWLNDEAYVLLEPHSGWEKPDTLQLAITGEDTPSDTLRIARWNNVEHYTFASHFYMALRDADNQFFLETRKGWIPVFERGDERLSLKKTLKDYFKLVGKMP